MSSIPVGSSKSEVCERLGLDPSESEYVEFYGHPEILFWHLPQGYRLLIAFRDETHRDYKASTILTIKRESDSSRVAMPYLYDHVYSTQTHDN